MTVGADLAPFVFIRKEKIMEQHLKRCPFCGGEAFLRKLYRNYFVDAKHKENCILANMCIPNDSPWVTREAAIAAWNERHINFACDTNDYIEKTLINHGQKDRIFKLGDMIKYNPHEVKEILEKEL